MTRVWRAFRAHLRAFCLSALGTLMLVLAGVIVALDGGDIYRFIPALGLGFFALGFYGAAYDRIKEHRRSELANAALGGVALPAAVSLQALDSAANGAEKGP